VNWRIGVSGASQPDCRRTGGNWVRWAVMSDEVVYDGFRYLALSVVPPGCSPDRCPVEVTESASQTDVTHQQSTSTEYKAGLRSRMLYCGRHGTTWQGMGLARP